MSCSARKAMIPIIYDIMYEMIVLCMISYMIFNSDIVYDTVKISMISYIISSILGYLRYDIHVHFIYVVIVLHMPVILCMILSMILT